MVRGKYTPALIIHTAKISVMITPANSGFMEQTIYDENKPNDTINEIGGQSADVNLGMGGKYVWLRVHRAPKPSMMVDNFWTHIGGERKGVPDLAKGSGGDYRYFCQSQFFSLFLSIVLILYFSSSFY